MPARDEAELIAAAHENFIGSYRKLVEHCSVGLLHVFAARGLELEPEPYPGMVLNPVPAPPAPASGVEVARVDAHGLDEFCQVSIDGGVPADLVRRLTPPSFAADPAVQLFVGRLDGRAVGTSIAIQSRNASGMVAVATLPEARRRGVGAAVSWAAVSAGAEHGHDTIVLQSSPMGFPVYAAMGFRTVVPYAALSRASATIR